MSFIKNNAVNHRNCNLIIGDGAAAPAFNDTGIVTFDDLPASGSGVLIPGTYKNSVGLTFQNAYTINLDPAGGGQPSPPNSAWNLAGTAIATLTILIDITKNYQSATLNWCVGSGSGIDVVFTDEFNTTQLVVIDPTVGGFAWSGLNFYIPPVGSGFQLSALSGRLKKVELTNHLSFGNFGIDNVRFWQTS